MTLINRFQAAQLLSMSPDVLYGHSYRDPNFPEPKVKGRRGGLRTKQLTQWDKDEVLHWHANRQRDKRKPAQGAAQRLNTLDNQLAQDYLRRSFLTTEVTP